MDKDFELEVDKLNKILKKKKLMVVGWRYIKKELMWRKWRQLEEEVKDFNNNKRWFQPKRSLDYRFASIYCDDTSQEQFILEQAGVLDVVNKLLNESSKRIGGV